jgi:hypothetical protein
MIISYKIFSVGGDLFQLFYVLLPWLSFLMFYLSRSFPPQDTHVIQVPFMDESSGFFAVYDGHGGKDAADLASAELHKFLEAELGKNGSVKASFVSAYEKMDDRLKFDVRASFTYKSISLTPLSLFMHIYTYIYICIYMHKYICIYVHTNSLSLSLSHTHTHKHIQTYDRLKFNLHASCILKQ